MPSLRTRTERRLEVGCFFKTPPAGGFLPLMVGQLTFPPAQAFPTHCIPSLQPAVCLLVCLTGLPQHGEAEEEAAKGGAAEQLDG